MTRCFLFLLFFGWSFSLVAQIPNASFESWMTLQGYEVAENWVPLDFTFPSSGVITCTKSLLHSQGDYSVRLMSRYSDVYMMVIPAWLYTGSFDSLLQPTAVGTPFAQRPFCLRGEVMYEKKDGDFGLISCDLSHWDTLAGERVTIASDVYPLTTSINNWYTFTMELSYFSNAFPDTCTLYISASSELTAVDSTTLWVDNLRFEGFVGLDESEQINPISIYPNPVSEILFIHIKSNIEGKATFLLINAFGDICKSETINQVHQSEAFAVPMRNYPPGLYLAVVRVPWGAIVKKIVIL